MKPDPKDLELGKDGDIGWGLLVYAVLIVAIVAAATVQRFFI